MVVEVGSQAPDFTLKNHLGETVRLSDFRGEKNVVVVFYPLAFSGICTGELCEIRDRGNDFTGEGVETLAISCDAPPSLKAFAEQQGLEYQLLSDFYPHGQTAKAYGVFRDDLGFANRATFIIDRDGVVRWSIVNSPGDARSTDEYREALADLN